jgi:rfaE bifunctional protein nucleotidyltransferase chain/domain
MENLSEKLSDDTKLFIKKFQGKKIVFTNGCFDILHLGHVEYLNEARALGDALVIAINSDASVKKIKGPDRPINNENDRKEMLLNLRAVDCVQIFNNETPLEIIKLISPQVLVKGGDWKVEQIVGHEFVLSNGGSVKSLSFKEGYSTSNLIKNVQGKS